MTLTPEELKQLRDLYDAALVEDVRAKFTARPATRLPVHPWPAWQKLYDFARDNGMVDSETGRWEYAIPLIRNYLEAHKC